MRPNGLFDVREAGHLGGLAVSAGPGGRRHMRAIRRLSSTTGRPRLKTFEEIKGDPRGASAIRALAKREGVDPATLGL